MKKIPIFLLLLALFSSHQTKMSKTISHIKALAGALERYRSNHGTLPAASTVGELQSILSRYCPISLPIHDGWGRELYYLVQHAGGKGSEEEYYWIGSSAGKPYFNGFLKYMLQTASRGDDIIFCNGYFVELPGISV